MFFKTKKSELYLIVGCGSIGSDIALKLYEQGENVIVLDVDENSFKKLSPNYKGEVIKGDATDIDILEQCGIKNATMVLAATNDDNANIMVAEIANEIFNVPKVFLTLYDSKKEQILKGSNITIFYPYAFLASEVKKCSWRNNRR